jgi:hypothetical protein
LPDLNLHHISLESNLLPLQTTAVPDSKENPSARNLSVEKGLILFQEVTKFAGEETGDLLFLSFFLQHADIWHLGWLSVSLKGFQSVPSGMSEKYKKHIMQERVIAIEVGVA